MNPGCWGTPLLMRGYQSGSSDGYGSDTDVARIVEFLHRTGPCTLSALRSENELRAWSDMRLEGALVAAWSQCRIFVDAEDELVPL